MVTSKIRFRPRYRISDIEIHKSVSVSINPCCIQTLSDALKGQEWVMGTEIELDTLVVHALPNSTGTNEQMIVAIDHICNDVIESQISSDTEKGIVYGEVINKKRVTNEGK